MIKISNWARVPVSLQINGHVPNVVPPSEDDGLTVKAGQVRITDAHYAALLALDSNDPRRLALGKMEVRADDNTAADRLVPSVPSGLGDPVLQQARFVAQRSSY